MSLLQSKTKAELDFIKEQAREMLVYWCNGQLIGDTAPLKASCDPSNPRHLYVEFAKSKGWLSQDGTKVLAKGFQTAAAFLRR